MLLLRKIFCAIGEDGKWKGTIRKLYEHGRLAQILEDLLPQLDVQHASLEDFVQVVSNVLDALALEACCTLALVGPVTHVVSLSFSLFPPVLKLSLRSLCLVLC
jgi:hypothetical protein